MVLIISENGRRFIIHDTIFSIEKYGWTFNLIEIERDGKIRNYREIELGQAMFNMMLEELRRGVLHPNFEAMLKRLEAI